MSCLTPVDGRFQTAFAQRLCGGGGLRPYARRPCQCTGAHYKSCKSTTAADYPVQVLGYRDWYDPSSVVATSCRLSDIVILTSGQSRRDNFDKIIDDMMEGLEGEMAYPPVSLKQKMRYMYRLVTMAMPKDVILIAGKGDETYQEVNGVRHHFSDIEEVQKIMREREVSKTRCYTIYLTIYWHKVGR